MSEPIEEIASSRYAARLLAARPEVAAELVDPAAFARDEMARALEGARHDDEASLKRRFRHLRQRVVLRVMARDLSRRANLDEVCGAMSDLAELEISTALRWLGAEGLVVVGMGKLGGRELNVSSDIDLVFLYRGAMDQQERYATAGKKLIRLLAELTEDGFAFRVDMRLRPFGDSGPLVCSFDSLETYLIAHGREWERYAWLKARPLTGSHHEELMKIVRPFVFRKYLDYATLGAMRRLHAEVRREVARRELADHVKLGPGGIREIEFVAQALQLIRGGRVPARRRAQAAVPRRRAAPRPAGGGRRSRAPGKDGRLRFLGGFFRPLAVGARCGLAPFRERVRRARSGSRAVARASASRRAALQPALRGASRRLQAPARRAGAGAREGSRGHRRSAGHARPRRRSRRSDRQPRRLPRPAGRESGGARARHADHRRLELGGRVRDAPSAAARRAARRSPALRAAGPGRLRAGAAFPARRAPGRHRAPHEPAARDAPGAGVPAARAGSGRAAQRRAAGRPPVRARRPGPGDLAGAGLERAARQASRRRAALRGDQLRQAGRQGARLCLGPRHHLPVRRCARAGARDLRAARAALQPLAYRANPGRRAVRHRPEAAAERRRRAAGVPDRGVRALPGA